MKRFLDYCDKTLSVPLYQSNYQIFSRHGHLHHLRLREPFLHSLPLPRERVMDNGKKILAASPLHLDSSPPRPGFPPSSRSRNCKESGFRGESLSLLESNILLFPEPSVSSRLHLQRESVRSDYKLHLLLVLRHPNHPFFLHGNRFFRIPSRSEWTETTRFKDNIGEDISVAQAVLRGFRGPADNPTDNDNHSDCLRVHLDIHWLQ